MINQKINKTSSLAWLAGMAAATHPAQSALVQIDLLNNRITAGGGNQLNADLLGTGELSFDLEASGITPGLTMLGAISFVTNNRTSRGVNILVSGGLLIRNAQFFMRSYNSYNQTSRTNRGINRFIYGIGVENAGALTSNSLMFFHPDNYGIQFPQNTGFFQIEFDASSVGGESNEIGFVGVELVGNDSTRGVELTRLIWDDASDDAPALSDILAGPITTIGSTQDGVFRPVPEPSGLALLAMGAAGMIVRRNRSKENLQ